MSAISRRNFVVGSTIFGFGGRALAQVELTGAWLVGAQLIMQKAGEYIAGKALGQAAGEISNEEVIVAIKSAASDVKRYVVSQVQRMFDDAAQHSMLTYVNATDLALKDYGNSGDREVLQTAYSNNVLALSLARSYQLVGLPSFVIALSQRVFIMKARAERRRQHQELSAFAKALRTSEIRYIETTIAEFLDLLNVENRLKNYRCLDPRTEHRWPRSSLTPPIQTCLAELDGNRVIFVSDKYYNGDDWDKVTAIGQKNYNDKAEGLLKYQADVRFGLYDQFDPIYAQLRSLARQIERRI